MGKDLYYMQTPSWVEEKYSGLEYSTWNFLAKLWEKEDRMDLDRMELDENHIVQLRSVMVTAESCGNEKLAGDMRDLLGAIKTMKSITLVIRD